MGFLQSASVNNTITYTQRDSTSSSTILENSSIEYNKIISSGTGVSQASKVYYTSGTLLSGQNSQFDLFSLSRSIFGATQSINFSGGNIKIFNIENGGSGRFNLVNTGNNGFSFNWLGSGIILYPTGYYSFINQSGLNITTGQRYFGLVNQEVFAVPYEITILGN